MFRYKLLLPVTLALVVLFPSMVSGRWSLTPRVYVEERYDDNIFLTETNEKDDFITTISPGVNLNYEAPGGEINLDYELQRVLYDDFSELDYTGLRASALAQKDFSPRFGAGIRETFIRSQDPIELTGVEEFERPSIRRGRNRYTRNIVEPEATFQFDENRSIRLGYRNNILRNKAEDIADQDQHAGNMLFNFRFDIRNDLEIFYEHINQEYDETVPPTADRDFDGDEIRGRYTYYFDPKTSAYFGYRYFQRDFETETAGFVDYEVHNPSAGFSRDLTENVSLSASTGYSLRDAEGRKDEGAFSGRGDLSARYDRLSLSLYGATGFTEDFTSAENLGFSEFLGAGINGRYQLFKSFWVAGFLYIERDRFVDSDRRDTLWSARGSLNYQLLRWLFLSFDYEHNERDSNIPLESYEDNRYFGRLTAQYNITELFQ